MTRSLPMSGEIQAVLSTERQLLGAILIRNEHMRQVNGLESSRFYDFKHRAVFAAMQSISKRGKPIDAITLELEMGGQGSLAAVGGLAFVSELMEPGIAAIPDNISHWADAIETHGRERSLRQDIGELTSNARIGPDELAARVRRVVEAYIGDEPEQQAPTLDPFSSWANLDHDYLTCVPPARRWLLRHPTRDGLPSAPRQGDGLLPLGKVGILASEGGAGKTNVIIALAISTVTGRPWLGHFEIDIDAEGGSVFIGLAEEDAEEIHRRFYNIAQLYGLSPAERALVSERIVALPLAGVGVALVDYASDGRALVDSKALTSLRSHLNATDRKWSLVMLDPLVRWAGPDVEKDNSVATRFVQALETLTQVNGLPTVLVPHHSSKLSRLPGGKVDARGVTGLTDGVRWVSTIRVEAADAWFAQTKSNYSKPMLDEVRLMRDEGGLLRAMTDGEVAAQDKRAEERLEAREAKKATKADERINALMPLIMKALDDAAVKPTSRDQLAGLITGTDTLKQAAITRLISAKKIVRVPADSRGSRPFFRTVYGKDDDEL